MKKALSLILALVLCLSLCACGGDGNKTTKPESTAPETTAPETTLTKEEMIASAEKTNSAKITSDTSENLVKAKQLYCDRVLEVTGFVLSIEEDHIKVGADRYVGTTVIDVYLPVDDLVLLSNKQVVTVVGKTAETINERTKTVSGTDYTQKYYEMTQAYLVKNTFDVTVTLDVNKYGGGTIKATASDCGGLELTPFKVPDGISTEDYTADAVTILTLNGTIIYGDREYYIQDYKIANTEIKK